MFCVRFLLYTFVNDFLLYTFVNELKKETYLWLFWKSMD